jgi:hypothetical protein
VLKEVVKGETTKEAVKQEEAAVKEGEAGILLITMEGNCETVRLIYELAVLIRQWRIL